MALFFGRWPADTKDWHQFQNLCGRCWTCGNLDELHTVGDTIGVCLDELFHHGHGEGLNPSGLRLVIDTFINKNWRFFSEVMQFKKHLCQLG